MTAKVGIRLSAAAIAVLGITLISSVALAYFTSTGAGATTIGVKTLGVPTISTATPGGGTVALTWATVTPPGAGTVTYYVTRDGGVPAGNCPTAASPGTGTTCTDSEVPTGLHSYKVTAKWSTWSATSAAKAATVASGAAVKFSIESTAATVAAGATSNLTITAQDSTGATVTSYTGAKSLTFSGASAIGSNTPSVISSSGSTVNFGTATAITFSNGIAAVASAKNGVMKLFKAGASSINATDGTINDPTPLEVTVTPLTTSKLVLSAAATVAGEADNLTTTAQDTYGNTATTYTGAHNITFSGPVAAPSGTPPTVSDSSGAAVNVGSPVALNFTAGVAAPSGANNGVIRLYKAITTNITATDGTFNAAALSVAVTSATASKLTISSSLSTLAASGSANLTTTALDPYGNTATTYTGSKNLTFSGANLSPNGTSPTVVSSAGTVTNFGTATAITFSAGIASVGSSKNGLMKLYKAEAAAVSVTDGTISSATPAAVTVSATTATRFALTKVTPSAGALAANCAFACVLTGLGNSGTVSANVAVTDAYANVVNNLGVASKATVTTTFGTITGGALTIATSGAAESTTQFTFTAPVSFTSAKITAAKSEGTAYTSATLEASK